MTKTPTDPSKLTICDDPLPAHRETSGAKYASVFVQLKFGQAIKCKPDEWGRIACALRKWIKATKTKGFVRSTSDYGDGMARVWMIEGVAK